MPNMDSMEKGFERPVESLLRKDMKEGDRLRIKTKNNEYQFMYTFGMLVALGDGHALAHTLGNFQEVKVGASLEFGGHKTSTVREIVHRRLNPNDAQVIPKEAGLVLGVRLKLMQGNKDAVSFTAEEARVLRDMCGIAQFSPDQKE